MSETTKKSSIISDTILIAAIPPIAYLFAFVFEAGYAHVFSIPRELISISLTNVFVAGSSFLVIGIFLLILLNLISQILPDTSNPVGRAIAVLIPLFLTTLAYVFYVLGTPLSSSLSGLLIAWIFILFSQFVFPLISQRDKTSYPKKLDAQAKLEESGILGNLAHRFPQPYLLVYYLGLALYITFYAGQSSAFKQRDFLVANTDPQCIALRVYGEKAVCAHFNPNTKQVFAEFIILHLSDSNGQEFTLESLGPVTGPKYAISTAVPSPVITPTCILPDCGLNTPTASP